MFRATVFASLLLSLLGCRAWYSDADTERLLAESTPRALASPRAQEEARARLRADTLEVTRRVAAESLEVDLDGALQLAFQYNRDLLDRRESLAGSGLSLAAAAFALGPQIAATLGYGWSDGDDLEETSSADFDASLSQLLPTGGTVTLRSGLGGAWPDTGSEREFSSSVSLELAQPLLRNAGYEVSHERLTQAQRDLVYALRDFELFRQRLSIDIVSAYYDLVSQRLTLANSETNLDQARYDREKAEALLKVDRNDDDAVFRARRREVQAEASLIDARAAYKRALDRLKIQLGLPIETALSIVPRTPPFEPLRINADRAVEVASEFRLDIRTSSERIADAERALRIAENGLLPDLDLSASYGLTGSDRELERAGPEDWSVDAGLTLGLPVQRTDERIAVRRAEYDLAQSRRRLDLALDQLDFDVRDQLRRLASTEQQIDLQIDLIAFEQRAVAVTEIRYLSGDLDNRELLEARQSLIDAENRLIDLKASHVTQRLDLLRILGLLVVDEEGSVR